MSAREKADVYVINTCAVTAMSESKSRQMISRAYRLNPQACIAVTGCYAQRAKQQLLEIPGVCIVAGTNHKSELPCRIKNGKAHSAKRGSIPPLRIFRFPGTTVIPEHT